MKGMGNIQKMLRQAQEMQENMQRELGEMRVEGSSGGGMVVVTLDGSKSLMSIKLDPEVVDKDDVEMLQDLVLAAINEANRKVDEAVQEKVGGLTGGMKIPGLT